MGWEAGDYLVSMFGRDGPADAASSGFEISEHGIDADPDHRLGEHLIKLVFGHFLRSFAFFRQAHVFVTKCACQRSK
jgi:hypothetical protein